MDETVGHDPLIDQGPEYEYYNTLTFSFFFPVSFKRVFTPITNKRHIITPPTYTLTVEPPKKGHFGNGTIVLSLEVV